MTAEEFLMRGRIRAKLRVYREKKQKALDICVDELTRHERPYLALSGGKDSVAMAFLVNDAAEEAGKDFRLWVHLSDASFPGTEETCREVSRRINRPLDISRYKGSAFDSLSVDSVKAFGKQGVFFSEVRDYAGDKDLAFVGTRAGESKRRKKAAVAHGTVFHSLSMGDIDVVNPLQWYTLDDVAAAISEYDAPLHPIYYRRPVDTGENSNRESNFIRLSYVTSRDLWEKGTLLFIKINYPDIYARMMARCPDIGRYT